MVLKRTDVTPEVQPAAAPKGIPASYGYGPAQLQAAYNLAAAATADGKNSTAAGNLAAYHGPGPPGPQGGDVLQVDGCGAEPVEASGDVVPQSHCGFLSGRLPARPGRCPGRAARSRPP